MVLVGCGLLLLIAAFLFDLSQRSYISTNERMKRALLKSERRPFRMLALFRKLFRRSAPSVRATDILANGPLSIEGGYLVCRLPIPPEEQLLEMLYQCEEKDNPVGIGVQIDMAPEFIRLLLQSANGAKGPIPWSLEQSAKP